MIDSPFDDTENDYINIISKPQKVPNEQRLPEVEALKVSLNDPNTRLVSLAGHINSGKTIILDIVHRELESSTGYESTKKIKVQPESQKDVNWITSQIVQIVSKQIRVEKDQSKHAIKALLDITETDAYQDVLLILDISLIPYSEMGKGIINFLYSLMQALATRLTILVSTLWSLEDSKLFKKDRAKATEILIQSMSLDSSVNFMREVNPKLSKQVARVICQKIECIPFFLKYIAEKDLERFFVVKGKGKLLTALDCHFDEVIEDICKHFESTETVQDIFNCLDKEEKELLAQMLAFRSEFDVKRATKITNSNSRIRNSSFNIFCEKGALLFTSRESEEADNVLYTIPSLVGRLLRIVVKNDKELYEKFLQAEKKHQELHHGLLLYMSSCLMGDTQSKNKELRVLGPFSATDGIPEKLSLTTDDLDDKPRRVVALFNCYKEDIKNSLRVFSRSEEMYKAAVAIATDLRVFYLLSKCLEFHEILDLYRELKLKAEKCNELDSEKLCVFIASICIHVLSYKSYSSEAKSLVEGAQEPLHEAIEDEELKESVRDPYLMCSFNHLFCLMAEKICKCQNSEGELSCEELEQIHSANIPETNQKVSQKAFLIDNYRKLAGMLQRLFWMIFSDLYAA